MWQNWKIQELLDKQMAKLDNYTKYNGKIGGKIEIFRNLVEKQYGGKIEKLKKFKRKIICKI